MNDRQSKYLEEILYGVLRGNLPEIVGIAGTWYTFRDKPYCLELAIDQLQGTALTSSLVGGSMAALTNFKKLQRGEGNANNPRHHKKKGKKHQ